MKIDAKTLFDGLNTILYAVSEDPARVNLMGVFFKHHSNRLTLVGTDGYRLENCNLEVSSLGESFERILPKDLCKDLLNALKKEFGREVELDPVTNGIRIDVLGTDPIELENHQYPEYEKVLPDLSKMECTMTINVDSLHELIKHVTALPWKDVVLTKTEKKEGNEGSRNPKATLTIKDNALTMFAKCRGLGECETSAPCQCTGKAEVVFSIKYLKDLLRKVPKKTEVTIHFGDGYSPLVMSHGPTLSLLMPCRP